MYQQYYQVGDKKFVNAYAALYESAQTQIFSQSIIPQYHLDEFSKVDVAKLEHFTTDDLIKQKLRIIRDSESRIRLHYTGGRDSHTILLAAMELGIKFDCVFTNTPSIVPDPSVELEYASGIEFANHIDMHNIIHRPSIDDFEEVWSDPWCFTKYDDFYHGFVPCYSDIFLRNYAQDYLEIVGIDKPWYFVNGDSYYWILNDASDYCIGRKHEDFFLGSIYPELTVKQVYRGYEFIKQYTNKQGIVAYTNLPQQHDFCKHLGLHDGIDNKKEKSAKDFVATGYFNDKHYRSMQQVQRMGRQDIIDAWRATSEHLANQISSAPYGIETRTILDGIKSTSNTIRFTAIFKILDDRLELLPHTDVNKLNIDI